MLGMLAAGVGLLALTGCASATQVMSEQPAGTLCDGVTVVVDFGILNEPAIDGCVDVQALSPALDVLKTAGVTVSGTDAYGSAVVCRVNDNPSAETAIEVEGYDSYTESCASMPPEFAYWALWVKQGTPDWQYAMVGASDLSVAPGDSVGLVFTSGTTTPTPN
jgi:hypothetical protein